jgi:hypothetical protein
MASALDRCEPLGLLLRRLQESRAHYDADRAPAAPGLRADVRAGFVDGDCWTLLVRTTPLPPSCARCCPPAAAPA